jgi:DegV family protein with EDD domain
VIGLVTDSNSQIPPELVGRYRVEVVPLTVSVDGIAYLEGVEFDADAFWERFRSGKPQVATSQPSPGRFAAAYRALAARGAEEILSVHIGSNTSGTVNSARLAASSSPVPVRVVDTGTASFGVTCCLWEAAEALAAGASADEAEAVALDVAGRVGMAFVVRALDLPRAGGRLAAGAATGVGAVPVLTMAGGAMEVVAEAGDVDEAADLMATRVLGAGTGLRVGVAVADAGAEPLADLLADRLSAAPEVVDLVRYRVGPSVGAHTGPGTAGAVYYETRPGGLGLSPTGRR